MQNKIDGEGLKRHASPINQSINVSFEQGSDSRQTDSATARTDDDKRRERSTDTVKMSKRTRKPGGNTAARLRRSSRLPRPTASASNAVVGGRRNDESPGVRRTRRLPTLQGVVINSPTYSTTRPTAPLVASIISKCRIPAPVTTRRISSWTDCWNSPTAASRIRVKVDETNPSVLEDNSRIESLTLNFGDSSTSGAGTSPRSAAGNNVSGSTTTQELKGNVRFSSDDGRLRSEHVCCGCGGTGLVSSHLLCIRPSGTAAEWGKDAEMKSRRRASPRSARVYRFDASAGHSLAVAQVAVENGLELLPSEMRRSDVAGGNDLPQTTSGSVCSHKCNSDDQTISEQVDDEPQLGETAKHRLVIGNELPNSELSLYERSLTETESKQILLTSSKRNDQLLETTVARSTTGGIQQLKENKSDVCNLSQVQQTSNFLGNSGAENAASTPQIVYHQQLASPFYVTDERRTAEPEVAEKSIASELRKAAKSRLICCRVSPITTSEEKTSKVKEAKVTVDAKCPIASHMRHEPPRRKRLRRSVVDRQNGKRGHFASPETSQMESEPSKFVTLAGCAVPINFGFEARDGIRRRSPLSVTFADKDERYRSQRSVSGRQLATRPPWRDLVLTAPAPSPRQECLVASEFSTEDLLESMSRQMTNSRIPAFRPADQSADSEVTVREQREVKTYPTSVAEAYSIESSENLHTSENLSVRKQATFTCAITNQCHAESQQHPPSTVDATPSFLIGIAPPPSLDEYHRKRPTSCTDESHSVEPTPSFISCSASEKDFPATTARRKNAADAPTMRRKTSAVRNVGSTSTHSENRSSSTSDRRSANQLSSLLSATESGRSSLLIRQSRNQNKTLSTFKTSTAKPESLRVSSTTAKHAARTPTPTARKKPSSLMLTATEKSQTKDLGAKDLHAEKKPMESRKRTGDGLVNASDDNGPTDVSFTPKTGQSKDINSKKKSAESDMKISRMKCMSRKLNRTSGLSGRSQFSVKNTPVLDFKEPKKFDEVPFVPLVHSACRSDEISNDLPNRCDKQPVSFFISCPNDRRSGSRTATGTSRIPRPQIGSFGFPIKSNSYVISTNATKILRPCTGSSSTEQHPALAERRSTNENPSSTSTVLRLPDIDDSTGDHRVSLQLEPQLSKTRNDSVDHVCIVSQDINQLNCVESCRSSQDVDSNESQPVDENRNQPPDNISLNALSTGKIANLITQDPAIAIESIQEHSTSTSQMTDFTAAPVPQKPSEKMVDNQSADGALLDSSPTALIANLTTQQPTVATETVEEHSISQCSVLGDESVPQAPSVKYQESLELVLSSYVLFAEPNLERLQMELCDNQLQYNSNIKQPPNDTSVDQISNLTTQEPTVATESIEEHSVSISQCTVLESASVPQALSEQSPQSLQLALSSSILSVEPNLERWPVKSYSNQLQRSSISPAKCVDIADYKTTEPSLFFAKIDHEYPVNAEVAKLDSDALEKCRARRARRTKTSKKSSCNKSPKIDGDMSLNIGCEVRLLRNFDEVSIELPDILWSTVQIGGFHQQEMARLYQPMCEAVVLRSAVRQISPPPSRRQIDRARRAKFTSRLLATAETVRDVVDPSAEVSINVVCSRIDRTSQSVGTAFQLTPTNLSSWINVEDAKTTKTTTESNTLSNYISARRYLKQLADNVMSMELLRKGMVSPPSVSERNGNRLPENRYQLEDLPNTEELKRKDEVELEERERSLGANEQVRRPMTSFHFTPLPEVKGKKNQIDVNSKRSPRLKLPRSDVGSTDVRRDETNRQESDDDQLPVDTVTRRNKNGDGDMSDEALPVLTETDKRGVGDEPSWQPSEDHELGVDKPSRLWSGEYQTPIMPDYDYRVVHK